MIESITISSIATFGTTPEQVNALSLFNFFFGSNGTGKTTLKEIESAYIRDIEATDNISNALLGLSFNSLIVEYDGFFEVIISDILTPVELINPKRRQGSFDKEVFRLISIEIKKHIQDFQFETEIADLSKEFLRDNTNWLLTEKTTMRIQFPLPQYAKKIDMLCKINCKLFIGTHKEQQASGGAQDNQAVDAGFLFNYEDNKLKELRKEFNVREVYLCVILERGNAKLTSSYWKRIIDIIRNKDNEDKYLLSSMQFLDLIKAEL